MRNTIGLCLGLAWLCTRRRRLLSCFKRGCRRLRVDIVHGLHELQGLPGHGGLNVRGPLANIGGFPGLVHVLFGRIRRCIRTICLASRSARAGPQPWPKPHGLGEARHLDDGHRVGSKAGDGSCCRFDAVELRLDVVAAGKRGQTGVQALVLMQAADLHPPEICTNLTEIIGWLYHHERRLVR